VTTEIQIKETFNNKHVAEVEQGLLIVEELLSSLP
jgi:hypothetical protein